MSLPLFGISPCRRWGCLAALSTLTCIPGLRAQAARNAPGTLDGSFVAAIEEQRLRGRNQVAIAYSLFPMDPYYNGYGIDAAYSNFFSRFVGWEVLRFHYVFTTEKDLTRQLADKYRVNPESIDRLTSLFSSSLLFPLVYGKQTLMDEYFFYHRFIFVLGIHQMNTSQKAGYGPLVGGRADFAVDERFSWTLEARYHISLKKNQDNAMMYSLGTAVNF